MVVMVLCELQSFSGSFKFERSLTHTLQVFLLFLFQMLLAPATAFKEKKGK